MFLLLFDQYLLNMFCNSFLITKQQLFLSKHFPSPYTDLSHPFAIPETKMFHTFFLFFIFIFSYSRHQICMYFFFTDVVYLIFKTVFEIKKNQCKTYVSMSFRISGNNTAKRTLVASQR